MKALTVNFSYYLDKPKIYDPKFYEIPRPVFWKSYEEFTLRNFQGIIDKVKFVYRNRNSDLHTKLYSTFTFELHWLNNKLHAIYGQEEPGEECEDETLDPILWHAIERVIRCMVEEGYAVKAEASSDSS